MNGVENGLVVVNWSLATPLNSENYFSTAKSSNQIDQQIKAVNNA
jgi:hypothetical protein